MSFTACSTRLFRQLFVAQDPHYALHNHGLGLLDLTQNPSPIKQQNSRDEALVLHPVSFTACLTHLFHRLFVAQDPHYVLHNHGLGLLDPTQNPSPIKQQNFRDGALFGQRRFGMLDGVYDLRAEMQNFQILRLNSERSSNALMNEHLPSVPLHSVSEGCVVELRRVSKVFPTPAGPIEVIKEIDLDIHAGQTLVVRGVSGSGKSTLLHILGSIDRATTGSVKVCGTDLSLLSPRGQAEFRAEKVGYIFQFFNLIPTLSALENVIAGLEPLPGTRKGREKTALECLQAVGLADQAQKYPAQMSGGQQQRVAIARAIAKRPAIVLADEPTGALDGATAATVFELLQHLKQQMGSAIVIATHDPQAAAYADQVHELTAGRLVPNAV